MATPRTNDANEPAVRQGPTAGRAAKIADATVRPKHARREAAERNGTATRAPHMPPNAIAAPPDQTSDASALDVLQANLLDALRSHYPSADQTPVRRAFDLAVEAHEGQLRATGEPYVTHPIASAQILA